MEDSLIPVQFTRADGISAKYRLAAPAWFCVQGFVLCGSTFWALVDACLANSLCMHMEDPKMPPNSHIFTCKLIHMLYNQYAESQCFVMYNKNHKDLALFKEILFNVLYRMSLGWYIFLEGILKNNQLKPSVIKITCSHQWNNKGNIITEEGTKRFVSLYHLFGNEIWMLSSDLLGAQDT